MLGRDGGGGGAGTGVPPTGPCRAPRGQRAEAPRTPAPAPVICPGAAHWMKRYGDLDDQVGLSVAADAAGNIAVAGAFRGPIDLGGGPLGAAGGDYSVYVARLDPSGQHLWSHAYPGGIDFVAGGGTPFATVAFAPSGAVILGGAFAGTVDFGAGPVSASSSDGDGFVAAFDPSGDPLWSARFGDPPPIPGNPSTALPGTIESVVVDPLGYVLALGYRASGPWGGMFVVKLDPQGHLVWRRDVSTTGTYAGTVRADAAGNVLVAGLDLRPRRLRERPAPGLLLGGHLLPRQARPVGADGVELGHAHHRSELLPRRRGGRGSGGQPLRGRRQRSRASTWAAGSSPGAGAPW